MAEIAATSRRDRGALLLTGGLILVVALWLRAAELGRPSLDTDEHYHVLAAQQLVRSGEARLPSGHVYDRALPYTRLVALSFRVFGVSETSARLPSVVFGVLVVLATFLIGRRWFGVWPGLLAAALVATSPLMVGTARLCRMYSLFQLLYLGAVFAYERGWEQCDVSLRRRAVWTGLGLGLAAASLVIHDLTALMVPATLAYWAGMVLARWRSRYAVYLLIVAAVGGIGAMTGMLDLADVWRRAHYVPTWAEAKRHLEGFYVRDWQASYPWLWWAAPSAIAFLIARHRALGWFVASQFAVPFALHSFIFEWKDVRYVSYLVPLLALAVSPCLAWGLQAVGARVRTAVASRCLAGPWRGPAAALAGAGVTALIVVGAFAPSLSQSLALRDDPKRSRWRQAYAFLAQQVQPGDAILAGVPLGTLYYLKRPATHMIDNGELNFIDKMTKDAGGLWVDWYSGLPLVTSLEEFLKIRAVYPRGWLLTNWARFHAAIPEDLQRYVTEHCQAYHPIGGSRSVLVFGWDERREPLRTAHADGAR